MTDPYKRPKDKQECYERRKALYERDNLRTYALHCTNGDNVYGGEGAAEYNWLARIHASLPGSVHTL